MVLGSEQSNSNYLYLYLFIGLSEINSKVLSVYRDKKFHTDNGKPSLEIPE